MRTEQDLELEKVDWNSLERSAKARLFVRLIQEHGYSHTQIGRLADLSRQRVAAILQAEGLEAVKPSPQIRQSPGQTKIFQVSERHRNALNTLGKGEVLPTLKLFEKEPSLMTPENIGEAEDFVPMSLSGLSDRDLALIDRLSQHMGIKGRSVVIRNVCEHLIKKHRLKAFYKPKGWKSRPINIHQAPYGKNPIPREPPTIGKTLYLPASLKTRLDKLKDMPISRPSRGNVSAFIRQAIQEVNPDRLTPVIKAPSERTIGQSVKIYREQSETLAQIRERLGFNTEHEVLLAIVAQALDRHGL